MNHSVWQIQDEKLSFGLKWSAIAHFVLIIVVLFYGIVFPRHPLPYIPTLKVDLVALPDVLKKDAALNRGSPAQQQQLQQLLKKAELEARKIQMDQDGVRFGAAPVPSRPSVEKRNKAALDRLKALSKIQDGADDSAEAPLIAVKGNKLSKGLSLSGDAKENAESNYLEVLRERISPNWNLPTWIDRLNLDAQVQIYVDARGRLRKYKFVKRSGHQQFDDLVIHAIQESQPFPFPPEHLEAFLLTDGILLGFPL